MDVPFLDSGFHFTFIPEKKFKKVDIFVEETEIKTNTNILISEDL